MPQIAVHSSVIYPDPFVWPLSPFHSKVPIAVHSSAIYPDPIFLAPTQFHSKAPNSSSLICHLSRSNLFGPYSIPLKSPPIPVHSSTIYLDPIFLVLTPFHSNASSLICLLSSSNLFGPYSIQLMCPKLQFTHLPFIQIQSFSLKCPKLKFTHLPFI